MQFTPKWQPRLQVQICWRTSSLATRTFVELLCAAIEFRKGDITCKQSQIDWKRLWGGKTNEKYQWSS